MTDTARTIIDVATAFSKWLSNHINVGGEILRQLVFLGSLLGYVNLTPDQQIGLMQAVSAIAASITGASVISKVTAGKRINEKVYAKVAEMTGSGTFKKPDV